MKLLEDRIRKDGIICDGDVLRVDRFLNVQIDIQLLDRLADEFYRLFKNRQVDKILTVEASGIAIAALTALKFGVPMVFAKKSKTSNLSDDVYTAEAYSFTHARVNTIVLSKDYLQEGEHVLMVDDFLANGQAFLALKSIVDQAGAVAVGAGVLVEKAFQKGHALLEEQGLQVEALARVGEMSPENGIQFL